MIVASLSLAAFSSTEYASDMLFHSEVDWVSAWDRNKQKVSATAEFRVPDLMYGRLAH